MEDETPVIPPGKPPESASAAPSAPLPRGRRKRRLLIGCGVALGVLLVLVASGWYLLFAWAKASGRIEAWVARRPDRFQLKWSELRSPAPFVFEAERLVVAVRTTRRSWELTADEARVLVDPLALLDRRLVLRDASARGLAFRLANAPKDDEADAGGAPAKPKPERGLHAPPIAAFPEASQPAASAPKSKPWTWVVDELAFDDLREIWIDDWRATGHGSGRVGFDIERREIAEVYRSQLFFTDLALSLGEERVGDRLTGTLDLQVLPWRYRGAKTPEVTEHVQGTLALQGEAEVAPVVRYLFGDRPWLEIYGDRGVLETNLAVDRGRLRNGSRLSAAIVDSGLEAFGFVAHGNATLDAIVEGERDQERLASHLVFGSWTLARPTEAPLFVGEGLTLDAEVPAPRADQLPKQADLELDLGKGRAPDLRFVNELVPDGAGIEVERGALELTGHLQFAAADRTGSGELAIHGEQLGLAIRGQRFAADLEVDLRLGAPNLAAGSFAIDGSKLALRNVAAQTTAGAKVEDWWWESEIVSGRVALRSPFSSAGDLKSRIADTRPLIAFYELRRDLPSWAEKALFVENVTISGKYRATTGKVALSDVVIPFANGEARAEVALERARRRARLLLSWRRLDLGVEIDGAARELHLRRAREWYEQGAGALAKCVQVAPGAAPAPKN